MATYKIAKPQNSKQRFNFIFVRIIFPPILLWDLLKLCANKLFGKMISRAILPAQMLFPKEYQTLFPEYNDSENLNDLNGAYEKHQVITHDGASLDTLEIKPVSESPYPLQTFIINFCANAACYEENISTMKQDVAALKANVIGFNYRGVSGSTGEVKSKDDLVQDGIAQVQRLLNQGATPENIFLKGFSLGGGIASLVALHFHQLGKPINLFNDRSFSSITNLVVGHIRSEHYAPSDITELRRGHFETLRGKIFGTILKPLIKIALLLTNWEIDASDAFKAIPKAYRNYSTVRTKNRHPAVIDDAHIPHYASIHAALKNERSAEKKPIDENIAKLSETKTKNDLEQTSANEETIKLLKNNRKQLSENKMNTVLSKLNGHALELSELTNRVGVKGDQFFQNFVRKAQIDHGKWGTASPTVNTIPEQPPQETTVDHSFYVIS